MSRKKLNLKKLSKQKKKETACFKLIKKRKNKPIGTMKMLVKPTKCGVILATKMEKSFLEYFLGNCLVEKAIVCM